MQPRRRPTITASYRRGVHIYRFLLSHVFLHPASDVPYTSVSPMAFHYRGLIVALVLHKPSPHGQHSTQASPCTRWIYTAQALYRFTSLEPRRTPRILEGTTTPEPLSRLHEVLVSTSISSVLDPRLRGCRVAVCGFQATTTARQHTGVRY